MFRRARGQWFVRTAWHADHIVAVVNGGRNQTKNIQLLCLPCHRAKTSREAKLRGRRRRLARRRQGER